MTPAIRDIRQFRASSAIPVLVGVTLFVMSPLNLFVGTRDWHTFGLIGCSGAALCVLGIFFARGSVWAAMILTGAVFLQELSFLLVLTQDPAISDRAGSMAVIGFYALLCWFIAKGLRAALRHRKFCRAAGKWHGKSKKRTIPRDRRLFEAARPFSISLLVYFCGVPVAVFAAAATPIHGLAAGLVYLPFAIVGSRLFNEAQRIAALRVAEIRKLDDRIPVLFIRSFSDDSRRLERRFSIVKFFAPKTLTLEEAVVNRSWGVGPVIGIGKPGEKLGPLGAAREYIEGDAWRDRIEHLMGESRLIVSVLGYTEGLLWEYEDLVRLGHLSKLLLVFPPVGLPLANQLWQLFQTVLPAAGRSFFPAPGKSRPLMAIFPEAGPPVMLISRYQNETAYLTALNVAIAHLERPVSGLVNPVSTLAQGASNPSVYPGASPSPCIRLSGAFAGSPRRS
ncbi:MAG TPA: hypothetical protein VN610_08330 [Bryobacteraceae bacterium]|nr:hypothetical protein [Bryobacteraceae bacterium]